MTENIFDQIPSEIKTLILKNLELSDLLNLCLVCKNFNDFISESKFLKNVWIKFYPFRMKIDEQILKESVRVYEKLKVNRVSKTEHFEFLNELGQPWKKVLIYNCEFKEIKFLYNMVQSFSYSVEELELSDIEVLNYNFQISPSQEFSNLKRVMFRNVPSQIIETFNRKNKNLTYASFDIGKQTEGNMPLKSLISNFLRLNQYLTHLQLGPSYINDLFDHQDSEDSNMEFQFSLEKLMLKFPIIRHESMHNQRNICSFLRKQQKISWILFIELRNEEILCESWNIKCLKRISLVGLDGLFDEDMDLAIEPNHNIIQVDLLSRKILLSQLRRILSAAPNLKTLHVHTLTKHIIKFVASNHIYIDNLTYETHDEEAFEVYDQLKSSLDMTHNINLKKVSFWRDQAEPNLFTLDPIFWHT